MTTCICPFPRDACPRCGNSKCTACKFASLGPAEPPTKSPAPTPREVAHSIRAFICDPTNGHAISCHRLTAAIAADRAAACATITRLEAERDQLFLIVSHAQDIANHDPSEKLGTGYVEHSVVTAVATLHATAARLEAERPYDKEYVAKLHEQIESMRPVVARLEAELVRLAQINFGLSDERNSLLIESANLERERDRLKGALEGMLKAVKQVEDEDLIAGPAYPSSKCGCDPEGAEHLCALLDLDRATKAARAALATPGEPLPTKEGT